MSEDRRGDFVTGPEFKRWMDEESEFKKRIENRMTTGFAEVKAEVALVASLQREANSKTSKHAEAIAVMRRDLEEIRREDAVLVETVSSIKDEGCSQYAEHRRLLNGFDENDRTKARSWVAGLSRPQKTVAVGGVFALLLPTVVDLVKIGFDALKWFESLHHNLTK